ncbi:MAG: hypothetical protein J4N77_03960 [Chloroflexi bacterium]|nr:hypothetical protein [Chloroflexota bacterium]
MIQWALIVIFILFLVLAYIIVQGTRAALAWRDAAASGDTKVIRDIVEDSLEGWRSQKRPKPVAAEVWRGVQSLQFVHVEADFVRVSATADSDYKLVDGQWLEMRNSLQEGIAITAQCAEMLFYEMPHYRPDRLQIDVYTAFRDKSGASLRECILSTEATREVARTVDWDEWTSDEIVEALGGRYRLSDVGRPLAITVEPPPAPDEDDDEDDEHSKATAAEARS